MNATELLILDALGEATPEQRAQLAAAMQTDPALAAEHAAMSSIALQLSPSSFSALPPVPHDLTARLDTMHTAAPALVAFPSFRRFVPLAAAASLALLAALGWLLTRTPHEPSKRIAASDRAASEPESLVLSGAAPPALAPQPGTKRALIVAVEPWPEKEKNPKRGSGWADAQLAKRTLTESWGFAEKDIVVLHEEGATTRNVVETFQKHLIAQTQSNDLVVISWTSHGTQVTDLNGDEPDGLDEVYCTKDFDWSKPETWFTDDLFGSLLAQLRTERVHASRGAFRGQGGGKICIEHRAPRGVQIDRGRVWRRRKAEPFFP